MEFAAWSEIDMGALKRNVGRTRDLVGDDVQILLTIKADAYGHGSPHVARAAVAAGVDMLGVATLHEGIELRGAGIRVPILILSPSLVNEIDEIVEWHLTPTVSDVKFAQALAFSASRVSREVNVHVEIDTGMTRAGVNEDEACDFLRNLAGLRGIMVEGVYTHLPLADDLSRAAYTREQLSQFTAVLRSLDAAGMPIRYVHAANSAAVLSLPSSHFQKDGEALAEDDLKTFPIPVSRG